MESIRKATAFAALSGTLVLSGLAPPAAPALASSEINYSPRYWELLDRYESVELTWAPIRGVYGADPECLLLQHQGHPVGCGDMMVILLPDATFSTAGWIEDPAAPNGWRQVSNSECMTIDWDTVDDPDRWAFDCGPW